MNKKATLSRFISSVCLSLLFAHLSFAVSPSWAKSLSSPKFGSHPVIQPLKLKYELSWKGALRSGNLFFELNKPDKRYPQYHISQVWGGSSGFASTLFPYKANFVSFLRKKNLKPVSFVGEETDKREHMKTTNRYKSSKVTSEEIVKAHKKSGKSGVNKKTFSWPNTFDAMSAMYYIRSQKLKKGDQLNFVLMPFRSPYFAKVTVQGREKHLGKNCIKLDFKLRKITRTFGLKSYKKLKNATLWLSDDQDRIPVELRSAVFIGDVRMTLQDKRKL